MERRHLTKFWPGQVSEHCVLIGQWGQTTQLIIYETNNGNLEIASVPVRGKREGHFIWESCLGQMEKGGSSQEAVSQTHRMGASLNCCCFPGAQGQLKLSIVNYYCFYVNLLDVTELLRKTEKMQTACRWRMAQFKKM